MITVVGRSAILVATGALLGLAINAVRPDGVSLRAQGASARAPGMCAQPAAPANAAERSIEVLAPEQAAALCGDPRTLVADSRSAAEFAAGHVTGAIHLPCASTRGAASAALDLLVGKQALIVYGNDTSDALPVADELRRRSGHLSADTRASSDPLATSDIRVAVLAGGFSAWSQAGLACSSGPCGDCQAPDHR
ncbi:MAG: rhodanese-like domain-containing protein [Pseudomonadota bacterium]